MVAKNPGVRGGITHLGAHVSWYAMMQRCYNKTHLTYPQYGAIGVSVDPEWHDYRTFYRDMGDRPKGFEIDRIDSSGNYGPSNCRWGSRKDNHRNKKNNIILSAWGEKKTLPEWSEDDRCQVSPATLRERIVSGRMSVEQAISTPVGAYSKGSSVGNSKLSEEEVRRVISMFQDGVTNVEIAKGFGVTSATIGFIRRGKTWKHVERG